MKNLIKLLIIFIPCLTYATEYSELPLDKVTFHLSIKKWVTTDKALLTVNVNATLTDANLIKARTNIISGLDKIAKGEWHIIQFNRSQDSSGLEKLFVEAQIRTEADKLTNIYQKAKDETRPGMTYSVTSLEFKPNLEEIEKVKADARAALYQKVTDEVARLNQQYPNQKYSVNRINFTEGEPVEILAQREVQPKMLATVAAPVAVNNEIILQVLVEVASNRIYA